MKRIVSIITTAVLTAAVGLTGSSAAWADDRDSRDSRGLRSDRPVYLALGDSLAAGQASVPPGGSVEATLARWKANGFVAQFHDALRDDLDCRKGRGHGRDHRDDEDDRRGRDLGHDRDDRRDGCPKLQLVNLSRTGILGVDDSGVTTQTILADGDQLDQAVALLRARNGDRSARNDVEVVTLTVGGNDLFEPAVEACVPTPTTPASPETCAATLAATFATVGTSYAAILAELRAAGGDDLVILTTTYYNPLPFCDRGALIPNGGAAAIGNAILEGGAFGLNQDQGFNDLIRAVSADVDATAVDLFGVPGAGDFVGGDDCLHPDGSGHRTIAQAFAAAFPG